MPGIILCLQSKFLHGWRFPGLRLRPVANLLAKLPESWCLCLKYLSYRQQGQGRKWSPGFRSPKFAQAPRASTPAPAARPQLRFPGRRWQRQGPEKAGRVEWRARRRQETEARCLTGSSVNGIFPGKDTGVGCHFLLQGIFLTQHLLHLLH